MALNLTSKPCSLSLLFFLFSFCEALRHDSTQITDRYNLVLISQRESYSAMVAADHVVRDVSGRLPCVIFTREPYQRTR
jgi:hypothetical protein